MALSLLLLATPVFGLALEPPALALADLSPRAVMLLQLEMEGEVSADGDAEQDDSDEASDEASSEQEADSYAEQMKERNSLAEIHRPLGIATWATMTVTVGLGFIQYYNKYGFFAGQGDNPCVKGDAVFGQDQCAGTPWPHAIAAGLTTALYSATFAVSLMMPDPDDLSSGKGEFAETLRLHKLLRWVHFGGMIAQIALGIVIANDISGLDRANDYDTLQTLATIHMAAGVVTWGALSWAGALMTF